MNRPALLLFLSLSTLLGAVESPAQEKKKEPEFCFDPFDEALEKAADKPSELLLMYCWAEGDDSRQWDQTMTSEKVITALTDYICFSAKKEDPVGQGLQTRYKVGVTPTMLFVKPDGEVKDVLTGFIPVGQMLDELERVREGKETLDALKETTAEKPDDLESQLKLARKLRALGDKDGYSKCADAILGTDPKAKTEQGAMVKFWEICDECFRPELTAQEIDLKPMAKFVVRQKNKRALFLGYDRLAAIEYKCATTAKTEREYKRHLKAAITACKRAWKAVPADEKVEWGARVAKKIWDHQRDLTKGEQKYALTMAQDVVKAFKKVKRQTVPNWEQMMAYYKYIEALAYYANAKRKEAIALMNEVVILDPGFKDYTSYRDMMKNGNMQVPKGFQNDG